MMIATVASVCLLSTGALADDKTKVEPGKSPTATMSEQVPTMKENCDQKAQAKPPKTEVTGVVDNAVPAMKPGDQTDCPGEVTGSTTKPSTNQ